MKRIISIVLVFLLLISACACSDTSALNADCDSKKELSKWCENKSCYPLGLKAQIKGIAASDRYFLAGGSANGKIALVRTEYSLNGAEISFGDAMELDLPEHSEKSEIIALTYGAGLFYVLLYTPQNSGVDEASLLMCEYSPEGIFNRSISIDYPAENGMSISMLVLNDGTICVRSSHYLALYTCDGNVIVAIEDDNNYLCPPLQVGNELLVQGIDIMTKHSSLNKVDTSSQTLIPLITDFNAGSPKSIIQSVIDSALINNGSELFSINASYELEEQLDWYELTLNYGQNYRYICQLREKIFLLVRNDSEEVMCLSVCEGEETRKLVRIGFYGNAADSIDHVSAYFNRINPDYYIDAINYGNDDSGLTRLLADLSTDDKLDIIISEGYLINPNAGFVDLYPFIDKDADLERDDFMPWMLKGIEKDGQLRQIWCSFGLSSAMVSGPLVNEPRPLRLTECQPYLNSIGYEDSLFDSFLANEDLVSYVSDNLIANSYDQTTQSYLLNNATNRAILELCKTLPERADNSEYGYWVDETAVTLGLFKWSDISLDYLSFLVDNGEPFRVFTGADDGDNFTTVGCYYRSCCMIPASCQDKENAWGFLRTMLTSDYQIKAFAEGRSGYPCNIKAFNTVLNSYASHDTIDLIQSLVDNAVFLDYSTYQMRKIFLSSIRPYLFGDYNLYDALESAQSKINIYLAEQGER